MRKLGIKKLLALEGEQLKKLNEIVLSAVEKEKLLSEKLGEFEERNPGLSERLTDKVAHFGGSWWFVSSFLLFMALWVVANLYWLKSPPDPYPFILLNLVLSTIAALQAPIILMSQNRVEEKDRKRAVNDYLVNLKAEIEIRNLHQKIDLLVSGQMKTLFEIQEVQVGMMKELQAVLDEREPKTA